MTIQQKRTSFAFIPALLCPNARLATATDIRRQRKKILKKPLF